MSCETSKAAPRRAAMALFQRAFRGRGIDIGAGPDPLHAGLGFPGIESCEVFDMEHGDANHIDELRPPESYDFVHASQSLEHMHVPGLALARWLRLVRPGGWLVFTVPDWTLYEGRVWPSRHNPDHKTCWGLGPRTPDDTAPAPPYVDVCKMLAHFPEAQVMLLQIADTRYDYSKLGTSLDQTLSCDAEAFIEAVLWKRPVFPAESPTPNVQTRTLNAEAKTARNQKPETHDHHP